MASTVIDVTLVVIAAISLFVGARKGLIKQLTSLLSGLLAFAGAIALVAILAAPIQSLPAFQSFAETASGWFTDEIFFVEISSPEQLSEQLANSGIWRIVSPLSVKLFEVMQTYGYTTLGQTLGFFAASAIVEFVLWLLLFILIKLVFKGINFVLFRFIQLPVIRTIDHVFGAIWSLALSYVILIGLILTGVEIVAVKFIPTFADTLREIIGNSTILLYVNDTNLIGSYLASLLGVELIAV